MLKWIFVLNICLSTMAQAQLFPFELKGKWGYMDAEGEIKMKPIFDYADDFCEGKAVVALRNLPCVINLKQQRIVDTGIYQYISRFSEGLAAATYFNGQKCYIDSLGSTRIHLDSGIYEARPFSNGIAVVSKKMDEHQTKFGRDITTLGYKFAFIDLTGKYVTGFDYDDADDANAGIAKVRVGNKIGLINTKGDWVAKPSFFAIGFFSDSLALADQNGKYGYINTKGEWVIEPRFDFAYTFTEGLAGASQKGKWGYINTAGEWVVPPTFEAVKPFAEAKAAVMKDGKWGFINKQGEWVIRNVFDNTGVFSENKCAVLVKRYWGFIDAQGRLVIPAEYDAAGSFHSGVADVVYKDLNLFINTQGRLLPIIQK